MVCSFNTKGRLNSFLWSMAKKRGALSLCLYLSACLLLCRFARLLTCSVTHICTIFFVYAWVAYFFLCLSLPCHSVSPSLQFHIHTHHFHLAFPWVLLTHLPPDSRADPSATAKTSRKHSHYYFFSAVDHCWHQRPKWQMYWTVWTHHNVLWACWPDAASAFPL